MQGTVFTIGHSTHEPDRFITLLSANGIDALCDVRSMPYSRMSPQFNREQIQSSLEKAGISYLFLGKELGARSDDPSCYEDGKVRYDRLARTALFQRGLERVLDEFRKNLRVVLMCTEKEPIDCHRMVLIARHLEDIGVGVQHIHADGRLESQGEALTRLAQKFHLPLGVMDMFRSLEDILADAYELQEERIAYDSRGEPA